MIFSVRCSVARLPMLHAKGLTYSPDGRPPSSSSSSSTGFEPPSKRRAPIRHSVFAVGGSEDVDADGLCIDQLEYNAIHMRSPSSPSTRDKHGQGDSLPLSPLARPLLQLDITQENGANTPTMGAMARKGMKRRVSAMLSSQEEKVELPTTTTAGRVPVVADPSLPAISRLSDSSTSTLKASPLRAGLSTPTRAAKMAKAFAESPVEASAPRPGLR